MPDINVNQLKEFFEFRANQQDKDIDNISKKLDDFIMDTTSTLADIGSRVGIIWKVGGTVAVALLVGIMKSYGV